MDKQQETPKTEKPVALVTGASSGIGRAAALALVKAGFEVVGTSRHASATAPAAGITFADLDVTRDESVAALVAEVLARFGRIDVLVNNAGFGAAGAAEESSTAQDQDVFNVNVFGTIRMTKAVLPHMRERGTGRIVNVSSIVGFMPVPFMAIYSASKHAIEGYSEALDHEVREHGIRVALVEPAWTNTSFEANTVRPDRPLAVYEERRTAFDARMTEAVRDGDAPAVIARVVLSAASDARPKLRYPAGAQTGRVQTMRRLVPARMFDRQVRKLNQLPA